MFLNKGFTEARSASPFGRDQRQTPSFDRRTVDDTLVARKKLKDGSEVDRDTMAVRSGANLRGETEQHRYWAQGALRAV